MARQFSVVFLFCCLVFLSQANLQPQQVKLLQNKISIAGNDLAQKYCPMRNFKGELFCPVGNTGPNGLSENVGPSSASSTKKRNVEIQPKKTSTNQREIIEIYELEVGEKAPKYTTLDIDTLSLESVQPSNSQFLISGTGFDRTKREIKFPGK